MPNAGRGTLRRPVLGSGQLPSPFRRRVSFAHPGAGTPCAGTAGTADTADKGLRGGALAWSRGRDAAASTAERSHAAASRAVS